LLQKARHCETSPQGRLADGYCYGDNDFIDKQLIEFLRTNDAAISALVRQHPADSDVARILVERAGAVRPSARPLIHRSAGETSTSCWSKRTKGGFGPA
jgi:hypothetical protein